MHIEILKLYRIPYIIIHMIYTLYFVSIIITFFDKLKRNFINKKVKHLIKIIRHFLKKIQWEPDIRIYRS